MTTALAKPEGEINGATLRALPSISIDLLIDDLTMKAAAPRGAVLFIQVDADFAVIGELATVAAKELYLACEYRSCGHRTVAVCGVHRDAVDGSIKALRAAGYTCAVARVVGEVNGHDAYRLSRVLPATGEALAGGIVNGEVIEQAMVGFPIAVRQAVERIMSLGTRGRSEACSLVKRYAALCDGVDRSGRRNGFNMPPARVLGEMLEAMASLPRSGLRDVNVMRAVYLVQDFGRLISEGVDDADDANGSIGDDQ